MSVVVNCMVLQTHNRHRGPRRLPRPYLKNRDTVNRFTGDLQRLQSYVNKTTFLGISLFLGALVVNGFGGLCQEQKET